MNYCIDIEWRFELERPDIEQALQGALAELLDDIKNGYVGVTVKEGDSVYAPEHSRNLPAIDIATAGEGR